MELFLNGPNMVNVCVQKSCKLLMASAAFILTSGEESFRSKIRAETEKISMFSWVWCNVRQTEFLCKFGQTLGINAKFYWDFYWVRLGMPMVFIDIFISNRIITITPWLTTTNMFFWDWGILFFRHISEDETWSVKKEKVRSMDNVLWVSGGWGFHAFHHYKRGYPNGIWQLNIAFKP